MTISKRTKKWIKREARKEKGTKGWGTTIKLNRQGGTQWVSPETGKRKRQVSGRGGGSDQKKASFHLVEIPLKGSRKTKVINALTRSGGKERE